ncbi:MAG: elongation factor G [Saprospiraceae bacterium]|nr:MAG: small GTP-binding protein [Bacteroidetes bacterium OLB9]MCO6462889.1 elongation factor G [Saprospiraceae bacterium]
MSVETKNIRNVVLLGHSGSGKTTLSETMLFESGAINRMGSVEAGNTMSDYTNIEQERGNSLFSSLMHVNWRDCKINILDTPGFDDFVGEVICSLKVADTALMVLNSTSGVEVGTEILWEYVTEFGTPTVFVINQIDHEKSDFEATLEQTIARFGPKVLPIQYPYTQGANFNSIIDALRMVMYEFGPDGGKPVKKPIPDTEMAKAKEMHNALVEAAAENEEGLMEKYFDQGTLSEEDLTEGLRIALANQQIFPVFCCSAKQNKGSGRIMGFINDIAPSPADVPPYKLANGSTKSYDSAAPTSIFIYKTISEPQVGLVSYFKVYSGTLHTGDELINANNSTAERINQIFESKGKVRTSTETLIAGDLGVTLKLKNSHTNETLHAKGADIVIEPIHFPEPRIRTAVVPPSKSDMEKLIKALHQIEEEDPTLIVEQNSTLKQTIIHGQGQLHLDLIKYRIEKAFGVHMDFERPRIPYRETITRVANEVYRHKKQSGGAGQFGEVHMRIEPYYEGMPDPDGLTVRNVEIDDLDWGGKLAFYWCIVGGTIDAKYSSAIKKGIMQKMVEGPLTGSNCQDIRVSIYDGKMHPVDSNDMAFMLASIGAFKAAFKNAGPQILEPIYEVDITCSDSVMGDIMGDLQSRRALIMGMDSDGHYQKIKARVPIAEMYQYSSTLRSLSQGKAKFTRKFAEYVPVTPDIQQRLIAEHQEEEED